MDTKSLQEDFSGVFDDEFFRRGLSEAFGEGLVNTLSRMSPEELMSYTVKCVRLSGEIAKSKVHPVPHLVRYQRAANLLLGPT